MPRKPEGEITAILKAASAGQPGAFDQVFSLVYEELRAIAKNRVKGKDPWTLASTELVHEAYLRLIRKEDVSWSDRHHFFWAAARAMGDILCERSRRENRVKRGGGLLRVELHEGMALNSQPPDIIDLREALDLLEAVHPEAAKVVWLKFFAGLGQEDIAEILNLSRSAVWREWTFARAWLMNQLDRETQDLKKTS